MAKLKIVDGDNLLMKEVKYAIIDNYKGKRGGHDSIERMFDFVLYLKNVYKDNDVPAVKMVSKQLLMEIAAFSPHLKDEIDKFLGIKRKKKAFVPNRDDEDTLKVKLVRIKKKP